MYESLDVILIRQPTMSCSVFEDAAHSLLYLKSAYPTSRDDGSFDQHGLAFEASKPESSATSILRIDNAGNLFLEAALLSMKCLIAGCQEKALVNCIKLSFEI
jgi:hypothetical protein